MEAQPLLQTSCVLFLLAALGGLAMAGIRFSGNRNPPVWLAMGHGGLAVAGVAALWSLVLLLVAAAGGTVLFLGYEWKRELLPVWLVLVHAVVAVAGFLLLVVAILQ